MVFIYEYELLFLSKQVVSFFLMCSIATGRINKFKFIYFKEF